MVSIRISFKTRNIYKKFKRIVSVKSIRHTCLHLRESIDYFESKIFVIDLSINDKLEETYEEFRGLRFVLGLQEQLRT